MSLHGLWFVKGRPMTGLETANKLPFGISLPSILLRSRVKTKKKPLPAMAHKSPSNAWLAQCAITASLAMSFITRSAAPARPWWRPEQEGRNCYMMELSRTYVDMIIARMKKLFPTLKVTRNGDEEEI